MCERHWVRVHARPLAPFINDVCIQRPSLDPSDEQKKVKPNQIHTATRKKKERCTRKFGMKTNL